MRLFGFHKFDAVCVGSLAFMGCLGFELSVSATVAGLC